MSDPSWSQYLADTWLNFRVWVGQAFEESPAIVLGLGFTLCVPVLVLLGAFMRRGQSDSAPSYDEVPQTVPVSAWQNEGVLIDVNNGGKHHTVGHGLVRIGREEDNDVQLVHKTVHRYHAIIERTPEAEFVLTDVSGDGGNGVRVDGERIERLRLRGGEVIDIGRIQLQFQLLQI
ncbi:MAG: FHA domain-containing protein [Hyphomicrobiaceae bacterium]